MGGTTVHTSPEPPGPTKEREGAVLSALELVALGSVYVPLCGTKDYIQSLMHDGQVSTLPLTHGPSSLGSTSNYEMSLLCSPSGPSSLPLQCHTAQ